MIVVSKIARVTTLLVSSDTLETVILLSHDDEPVAYAERILFDTEGQLIEYEQGRIREFYIEA